MCGRCPRDAEAVVASLPPQTALTTGKRGYTPYPHLVCRFEWREVGAEEAVPHELSFWLKPLSGAELP
jgi:hypothetical protein